MSVEIGGEVANCVERWLRRSWVVSREGVSSLMVFWQSVTVAKRASVDSSMCSAAMEMFPSCSVLLSFA